MKVDNLKRSPYSKHVTRNSKQNLILKNALKVNYFQEHEIPSVPKYNNWVSDGFHDVLEGVLSNVLYSSINLYLIISKECSKKLRNDIVTLAKIYNAGSLLSVLNESIFDLNTEKRKIFKKSKFIMSGEQNLLLCRIFFEYLNQNMVCENQSSILQSMYWLLKNVLCIAYLLEDHNKSALEISLEIDKYVDQFLHHLKVTFRK
uniref:NR LBD domain-containing protein n=1 Tax=Strongyloides papillosus TaxID=174720 RepID=A0A0N5CIQ8_STREA